MKMKCFSNKIDAIAFKALKDVIKIIDAEH